MLDEPIRKFVLPYHRVLGVVVMVLSLCAIGMGYEDRQRLVENDNVDHFDWGAATRMENAAMFFIGTSVACVVFALSPAASKASQVEGENSDRLL